MVMRFQSPLLYIRIYHECESRIEKSVPRIAVWHHEACRVTTNGDPGVRIFLSYSMAFRWRTDDDQFIAVFGPSTPTPPPPPEKKSYQIWTPSDKTFWIRVWHIYAKLFFITHAHLSSGARVEAYILLSFSQRNMYTCADPDSFVRVSNARFKSSTYFT